MFVNVFSLLADIFPFPPVSLLHFDFLISFSLLPSHSLLENIDEVICQKIEHVIESQCLISGGILLAGAWFLFAQVICLEIFVILTLRWTAPKVEPHRTV